MRIHGYCHRTQHPSDEGDAFAGKPVAYATPCPVVAAIGLANGEAAASGVLRRLTHALNAFLAIIPGFLRLAPPSPRPFPDSYTFPLLNGGFAGAPAAVRRPLIDHHVRSARVAGFLSAQLSSAAGQPMRD